MVPDTKAKTQNSRAAKEDNKTKIKQNSRAAKEPALIKFNVLVVNRYRYAWYGDTHASMS